MSIRIHPTADVSEEATIGEGTQIWHYAQIREGVVIGRNCIIGKGTYVDFDVHLGDCCKLQNGVNLYHGAYLEDGVFLGPGVMVLNDKIPRAISPDGTLKTSSEWEVSPVKIGYGVSIGGGAIILPGITLGKWSMIGSGAVVTGDVQEYGIYYGNPAKLYGFACPCGNRLPDGELSFCPKCGQVIDRSI